MSKTTQKVKKTVELEFDDARFQTMGEMLAKMRDMTRGQFYAECIQAMIGSYIENGDLGGWGQKMYDEMEKDGYL